MHMQLRQEEQDACVCVHCAQMCVSVCVWAPHLSPPFPVCFFRTAHHVRLACFVWTVLKNVVLSEHQTYHAYFQQRRFGKLQEGLVFFFLFVVSDQKCTCLVGVRSWAFNFLTAASQTHRLFSLCPHAKALERFLSVTPSQTFSGESYVSASTCSSPSFHVMPAIYHPEIFICFSVDKIHPGPFATNYLQNINPQTAGCWLMLAQTLAAGAEKNNWVDCSKSSEISIS